MEYHDLLYYSALFFSSLQLLDNGDVQAERRKFDSRSSSVGFFPEQWFVEGTRLNNVKVPFLI